MKILYAIQGTGNGHLSRARDIIPMLQKKADLDILISGTEAEVALSFEVKYNCKGLSFVFGKKGGIDLLKTYKKVNLKRLYKEIKDLPVENYDLVINDFEPVSAWACKMKNIPCIGLSHQAAVMNKRSPKPKKTDAAGKSVLGNYAPVTRQYGFHFESYDQHIFTPVIRQQIRYATPVVLPHYTVYLPAYSDERIISILMQIEHVEWQVFSKHTQSDYTQKNVHIHRINNDSFIESLLSCTGILCGAGFETPAEALFLQKKLMVIPMKGQYEQQCNAAALKKMGVPVIKSLKSKHLDKIMSWVSFSAVVSVNYPDITEQVIDELIRDFYFHDKENLAIQEAEMPISLKRFRHFNFGRILQQISR